MAANAASPAYHTASVMLTAHAGATPTSELSAKPTSEIRWRSSTGPRVAEILALVDCVSSWTR